MRLGRTTLVHFTTQVLVSVAGFAATFAIARFGGSELLGVYTVAAALVFWFNVPTMAVAEALTKRLSEGGDRGGMLVTAVALNGSVALGIGGAIVVGGPFVDQFVGARISELVALLFISNVALITILSALRGEKRIATSGGVKATERVVRSVLQVGAVVLGYGVAVLVASHAIASVGAASIGLALLGTRFGIPSIDHARSLLRFARYSWLGTLRIRAFAWIDTIVLAFFVVPSLIGIYEVAWNLASLFALVAISVQTTLFPELSELSADDDYDRIHHYLEEGLVFTGVFTIPGLFGALVVGERVLRIYSAEFARGVEVLAILIVARMLSAYGEQFVNAINAIDRPDVAFWVNLTFVGTNLVLNVVLVAVFGWTGAAVATALSATTMLVLAYGALASLIGTPSLPFREFGAQITAATAMAVVIHAAERVAPLSMAMTIVLVALGVVVYFVVLLGTSARIRRKFRGLVDGATSA